MMTEQEKETFQTAARTYARWCNQMDYCIKTGHQEVRTKILEQFDKLGLSYEILMDEILIRNGDLRTAQQIVKEALVYGKSTVRNSTSDASSQEA